ncbi:hypothetical protein FRC14_007954 [Serendipita sp. 396]|nr:hypothetical protein FRC14_007954 [Serendipita sp. 396]KAG8786149.1 hypothetical protein FRC15_012037 [Serendipita sp. 397]KAG8866537.1 hypothetical protein FRC20_008231 [Serendipita sp. 405]KAG9058638.1 hypothetical protein FS842_005975 [Serendipita sp. 407]
MDPNTRVRSFKMPPLENSQNSRRMRRLEEQKRSRSLRVDSARNVDIFAGLSLNDVAMEEEKPATDKAKRPSKWANILMYAEVLEMQGIGSVLPDDFGTAWMAVTPVPRGKRCLLVAYKNHGQGGSYVTLRSRLKGNQLMTFVSPLPTDTVLDCILDENWRTNGILHVLDVLRWKSQDYTQCEASFRFWWRDVKLQELPRAHPPASSSSRPPVFAHPHTFQPIPHFPSLQDPAFLLSTIIPLARDGISLTVPLTPSSEMPDNNQLVTHCQSDGVLFYVSESSYEAGSSLLSAWVPLHPMNPGEESPLEQFSRLIQAVVPSVS